MSLRAAWEARATALLRPHGLLLGAVTVGTFAVVSVVVARSSAAERPAAVPGILTLVGVLAPAIIAHGAVSGDLRSGVALLWLQKPVNPIRFYLTRGLDVLGVSILLMLGLSGGAALLATSFASSEVGRLVMSGVPITVLIAVSVSLLVFAFSSWGTSLDALLAFFAIYLTGISLIEPGLLRDLLTWVGFPLESTATIGRYFATGRTDNLGLSVLRFIVFVTSWTAVACLGLFVTTRSPLARESTR